MYEIESDKLAKEYSLITKYIFEGLTMEEIAQRLNCSQSTISNRKTKLFKKYNAKTKFEFVLGVMGEIIRNKRVVAQQNLNTIDSLNCRVEKLTTILKNIILNRHNKNSFDYWINEAKDKL